MMADFSEKAQKIIAVAESIAFDFGHSSVGSEHLLLSFLKVKENKLKMLLEKQNITYELVKNDLLSLFEKKETLPFYMEYTPVFREILEKSIKESKKIGEDKVSVEVLALETIRKKDSLLCELLERYGCDFECIVENLKVTRVSVLESVEELTNLNKKALQNPVNVYAREEELELVCNTLLRKQKANVMLIGEPGVGKSALIEHLAYKISKGEAPEGLKGKNIYELDVSAVVAGTKYRGEFEEKLKKIVKKIKGDKNAIIFIDEIHNIVGAGGAEGAIDASNILKPYLARGEFKCIGATTYDEYVKIIEKEKAIERRFQVIKLEEPNAEKCSEILKKTKNEYERFHGIEISSDICDMIVELSKKYIVDRFFPDKALDVLDYSCVIAKKNGQFCVDKSVVVKTIEALCGAEINCGMSREKIAKKLNEKILGQSEAIEKVTDQLACIEKGLLEEKGPLAVFLFVGPSGVGKTQLAKELSKLYFGTEESYVKIDMSDFKEVHSVSKILGAAPGYVGFDSQTLLVDKIRKKPSSVVILDEIEKAHKDVLDLFLNVFDEGYFFDAKKRKIDFSNSIIVMTSNLGCGEDSDSVGFVNSSCKNGKILKAINEYFSSEFINRIDEIVYFNYLDVETSKQIINNQIKYYQNKIDFEVGEEEFFVDIVENSDVKKYGARFLKREVKKKMLKVLKNRVEVC